MIFATIGTNEQPFDRLVRAVASLPLDEDLVVQYGSSGVPHGRGRWVDFMSYDEMTALMREARVVVCHAGVGSIMLARKCGQRPVVLARRVALGEAVDDHQLPLARRLHAEGLITLVEDDGDLIGAVREVGQRAAELDAPGSGTAELSAAIRGELGRLAPALAVVTGAR